MNTKSKIKCVHSSGRYDVIDEDAYNSYRRRAHLVTHTEAQNETRILGGRHWGVIHGHGGPRSDPAIEYNLDKMECTSKFIEPVSSIEYRREGGGMSGKLWLAVGIFVVDGWDLELLQGVIHMPRWSKPERRETYLDAIDNIRRLVLQEYNSKKLAVRITADWNRDLKDRDTRLDILREFYIPKDERRIGFSTMNPLGRQANWDWTHNVPTEGGTFGRRLYDGSILSPHIKNVDTYLIPDNRESDHRPYASELVLK